MISERLYHHCIACKSTVLKSAENCPQCGEKQKKDRPIFKYLGVALMTWVIIAGVMSETEDTLPAKPNTKDEVRKEIELDFSWGTEGFGAIMKANFTISNKSHKAIKDIKIHCLHFAGSETKIDQNTKVIYEVIEAHSKRSFSTGRV